MSGTFGKPFESERHAAGLQHLTFKKDAQCWAGVWIFEATYFSLGLLLQLFCWVIPKAMSRFSALLALCKGLSQDCDILLVPTVPGVEQIPTEVSAGDWGLMDCSCSWTLVETVSLLSESDCGTPVI